MDEWSFKDYLDERGGNPIASWLHDRKQVPIKAKAKIDRILTQLAGTKLWVRPLASNLDDHPGIVEIRVRHMNTQYRILGFRGPGAKEFTLLTHAVEKDDKFEPASAPETAETRMQLVKTERNRSIEHRFS